MRASAKKSLGQHFLFNPVTLDRILDLADVQKTDCVLEIGPGPGAMTERIAARAGQLIAVEMDSRFAQELQKKFEGNSRVMIVEGDFLKLDFKKILGKQNSKSKWKVVANLPYNVGTEIIFRLLEYPDFFQSFHVMLQKEVADRIVSKPGSKSYGILSIMTQLWSENRIVMKLKPGAFTPPPKVDSAVVEFKIADRCRFPIQNMSTFQSMVRAAFGQRRKTIANALKGGGFDGEKIASAFQEAKILPQARAETISIEKFVQLANAL